MCFDSSHSGFIGCEREFFLATQEDVIVPAAHQVLALLNNTKEFSYELSACQIEYKTSPCSNLFELEKSIINLEKQCISFEKGLGLKRLLLEVAPDSMPRDIFPDQRYERFEQKKNDDQILAMLQILACHFHVGMPDYETAREVYNSLIPKIEELVTLCDHSNGKRMELYKRVTSPHHIPVPFRNIEEHYEHAVANGYDKDLKNCHSLIRITRYGTIEFRMFGAAQSLQEIVQLGQHVLQCCNVSIPSNI